MSTSRWALLVTVVSAAAGLAIAAAATSGAGAAVSRTAATPSHNLVVAGRAVARSLDADSSFIPDETAKMNLYDTLVVLGTKPNPASQGGGLMIQPDARKVQPDLAESWKTSNNGSVWDFNLRHGVKSQYGNEMTADDVKWSIDRAIGLGLTGFSSIIRSMRVKSVEVVGRYQVRITTTGQSPALLLRFGALTNHPVFDSTEAKKHVTSGDPWARAWLSENAAGFGPYQLASWTKGQQMIFRARPDYWGPKPYYSQVTMLEIPNIAGRLASLEQGNIQMALDLSPDALQQVKRNQNLKVVEFTGNNFVTLFPNYKVKELQDRRVRQAMAKAIPYEEIIKGVYFGQADIAKTQFPLYLPYATGRFWRYPTDYAGAKQLLAQAGYPNGFELSMQYANEHPELDPIVAALQTSFAKIGIKLNLERMPENVAVSRAIVQHDLPMLLSNTASPIAPDGSTTTGQMIKGAAGNVSNYFTPKMESLHQQVLNTLSPERRAQLFFEVQRILMTDLPTIPVVIFRETIAMQKDIGNYTWSPTHGTDFAPLKGPS